MIEETDYFLRFGNMFLNPLLVISLSLYSHKPHLQRKTDIIYLYIYLSIIYLIMLEKMRSNISLI